MRRRKYDDDDGSVVVNMNVDGMPWYTPPRPELKGSSNNSPDELTRKETFWVLMGAMRAGLVIAGLLTLALLITVGIFLIFSA